MGHSCRSFPSFPQKYNMKCNWLWNGLQSFYFTKLAASIIDVINLKIIVSCLHENKKILHVCITMHLRIEYFPHPCNRLSLCSDYRKMRFVSQTRSLRQTVALLFSSDPVGFVCPDITNLSAWVAMVITEVSVNMYAVDNLQMVCTNVPQSAGS